MMQQNPTSPSNSLREQAVHWIVRLHSGSATSADRRKFDAWLASNPEHRREFDDLSRMWKVLEDAQPLLQSEIQKAEYLWTAHDASRQPASRWLWGRWGLAATLGTVLLLLLVVGWWWTGLPETILYETAKGGQRQVTLAEGSTVTLNTDTRLSVEFARHERSIRLDRGEAWFTVRHDERRPFTVQAANGTIRDIGTQFIVNKDLHEVRVAVLEGMVEMGVHASRETAKAPQPVVLHAGEQVSYGADGLLSSIVAFDRNNVGSWREGKLIFRSQPLKQVLAEVARYRAEDIRLLDPSLEAFPVSGVVRLQDLGTFLQTLPDALPVRVQRVDGHLITVDRVPVPPPSKSRP